MANFYDPLPPTTAKPKQKHPGEIENPGETQPYNPGFPDNETPPYNPGMPKEVPETKPVGQYYPPAPVVPSQPPAGPVGGPPAPPAPVGGTSPTPAPAPAPGPTVNPLNPNQLSLGSAGMMNTTTVAGTVPAPGGAPPPTPQAPPAAPAAPVAGSWSGVDPARTFDATSARAHLEAIMGRPMTQAEMQQAVSVSGWNGSGSISGEQLNRVIQAGAGLAGRPYSAFGPQAPAAPGQPSIEDDINRQLRELLNPQGYDPNSAENMAQKNVFGAQQQRSAERRRAAMAERAAARGESGAGGLDVQYDQIQNDRGMAEAEFEADLMRDELQGQRDRLMQALQLGSGRLSEQQTRDLQRELGMIDAEIRRSGIKQQGELGRGDLALRLQQLLQGDRQFYDNLGSENSRWMADYNQRALRDILGAF